MFIEIVNHFSVPYPGHCRTVYAVEMKKPGQQFMKHIQI